MKGDGNRAEAVKAWHRLMAGGLPGEDSCPRRQTRHTEPGRVTVQQVVAGFLADLTDRAKPRTAKVYRFLLSALVTVCGDRPLDAITPADVEAFSRKPSWSVTTRRCFIDAAVAICRWASDRHRRWIAENPLAGIRKPPKASRGRSAVISEGEYRRLIGKANPALRSLLILLWETGARLSEVCRLTAADVDVANAVAVLEEHKTDYMGRPRLIVLTPTALDELRPLLIRYPRGPLVRRLNATPWDVDSLYTAVRSLRRRAGVPHATAYGFRHSFATDALGRGVPDAQVSALLGQ